MFAGFTFEAASRHPPGINTPMHTEVLISPTSSPCPWAAPRRPYTPPADPMVDLAQRFNQQTLSYNQRCQFDLPTPPHEEDLRMELQYPSQSQSPTTSDSPHHSTRLQRQRYTRLQCDALHIRSISALVERMIDAGEQCRICSRLSSSDEAVDDSSEDCDDSDDIRMLRRASTSAVPSHGLKYKRSGELFNSQAGVAKDIRLRRPRPRNRTIRH